MEKLHAIIPAGGAGSRLWPLSRQSRPKFLLDLETSGKSLLQKTALRLAPVSASITVVTGHKHVVEVQKQLQALVDLKKLPENLPVAVITEPAARDSMAAIGLATYLLAKKYGDDAVVGSFAADHSILRPAVLQNAVRVAIGAADAGYVTTIGLTPESPSTAFGYIQPTDEEIAEGAFLVKRFVEKPSVTAAAKYVKAGYLWNAGMFVMQSGVLKKHLAQLRPDMDKALSHIADSWSLLERQEILNREWKSIEPIAIDHAIAEPVASQGGVATVIMSESGWTDLGDFEALDAVAGDDPSNLAHVVIDSKAAIIRVPSDKAVVVIGVPDAIVVDTGDALLVTTRENAQRVKEGVDVLKVDGQERFL